MNSAALMNTYARFPVAFVRGEGAWLWDTEGKKYLDALSGIAVNNLGHCHPDIVATLREQAGQLLHISNLYFNEPQLKLSSRLAACSLGDGAKVFFTNSGAEAVEAALKLARKAKRGGEILVLHGGFHGRTYGALSATPQEEKQAAFAPLVPGFRALPATPDALHAAVGPQTAAVLCEPIQGETGVHILPDELLQTARELCDEYEAALIFDEVQTGLGRTGTLWAFEHSGVKPDLITTAKALGGGLPIGALIAGERFADVFAPGDHGSTFAGGPLVCNAALTALDLLADPALLARVQTLGQYFSAQLQALDGVRLVRGRGLMVGVDLVQEHARELVQRAFREEQLLINATGPQTLRFLPPLVIDKSLIDELVLRLKRVFRD